MRYTHGTILTDKLYTGQRLSGDLGLYDYKARWFDPIVGRFLMEDPIIPSQGVMRLDRFAYVNNSPYIYTDPSGHLLCDGPDLNCTHPKPIKPTYFIVFKTEASEEWGETEKTTIENIAHMAGNRYGKAINDENRILWRSGDISMPGRISSRQAFFFVHDGPVTFARVSASCVNGCAGEAISVNEVWIYNNATASYVNRHPGFIAHELGHTFNRATGRKAQVDIPTGLLRPTIGDSIDWGNKENSFYGYGGGFNYGQFGVDSNNIQSEEFADMFAGWIYGFSGNNLGLQRQKYMDYVMPLYLMDLFSP